MEHSFLYTHSVRGTLREGSYITDSEKHVMEGSEYGSLFSQGPVRGTHGTQKGGLEHCVYLVRNCTSYIFSVMYNLEVRPGQLNRYSDSLQAGRSGDQILVGARSSAPVQTEAGSHPSFYTMGTGYSPGVKRPGSGVDHPRPSSAEVKKRVELYVYYPSGPSWPVIG